MRRSTFALAANSPSRLKRRLQSHQPPVPPDFCVGNKPGCFSTIQAAINAAHDGDTINIRSGRAPAASRSTSVSA